MDTGCGRSHGCRAKWLFVKMVVLCVLVGPSVVHAQAREASMGLTLVLASDAPDFDGSGGIAISMSFYQRSLESTSFGFRLGCSLTSIPYGYNDGERTPFYISYYSPRFEGVLTAFTTAAFATQLGNGPVRVNLLLGAGFLLSEAMGGLSLLPSPFAGIGVASGSSPTRVQLALEVWHMTWYKPQPFLFFPTVSVVFTF